MTKESRKRLVWMDLEMTGLDSRTERIIEIAVIVTDDNLEEIATGPVLVIHQDDELLESMDDWNQKHHKASGLIDKVKKSRLTERDAELQVMAFLKEHLEKGASPLCGNSIGQDRRFLFKYMNELESFFHYRSIDVSSIKELVKRWYPKLPRLEKKKEHTALEDIRESILELRYYRSNIFVK